MSTLVLNESPWHRYAGGKLGLGDCLHLLKSVPDGVIDFMFADLPYGVTANKWDSVIPFEPLWEQLLRVGKKNCAFVFTATQPFATALINSNPKLFRYGLVWDRCVPTGHLNVKKQPLRRHESVFMLCRETANYQPQMVMGMPYTKGARSKNKNYGTVKAETERRHYDGSRYPSSILPVATQREGLHPTQKPVALLEWFVKTYSNEGDIVLDPTMGSGTTGVACVNTGRRFVGIEQDPMYFETAVRRITEPK